METAGSQTSENRMDGDGASGTLPTSDPGVPAVLNRVGSPPNPPASSYELLAEIEALRESYRVLDLKFPVMEEKLLQFQHQRDEAVSRNAELSEVIEGLKSERYSLVSKVHESRVAVEEKQGEFRKRIEVELNQKEKLKKELEISKERIKELETEKKARSEFLSKNLNSIRLVKENLVELIEGFDDEKVVIDKLDDKNEELELELDEEFRVFQREIRTLVNLSNYAYSKADEYKEARKKEKRELGNSLVSLTEENRDISSLLRVALVEKEAVEKTLNKLKGNTDQKRVALLQRVGFGFGFMMGGGSNEQVLESSAASTTTSTASKSEYGSESEEEVISLVCSVRFTMN